ncbi:MAG: replication protein P [Halioglobus sp.]
MQRAAREIEASSKTSQTPAGQSETGHREPTEGHIDALNQVFALFRLNYHNQYYAAFPDSAQVNQIKKLWLDSLADYPVEQVLRGARHAIENSEYLPTLNRMHECCQHGLSEFGLPRAHDAYMEACNASSPKSAQPWSHPAVYLAGRDSNWFFLSNNTEYSTWPIYREHYKQYCSRVMRGETLSIPEPEALERDLVEPLSKSEQLEELQRLRSESGL